jgi:hypothetical protein
MKLDLLTNATVVDDAIRFVAEKAAEPTANVEPPTIPSPAIIENEKQEEENNKSEQESDSTTITVNQVF